MRFSNSVLWWVHLADLSSLKIAEAPASEAEKNECWLNLSLEIDNREGRRNQGSKGTWGACLSNHLFIQ